MTTPVLTAALAKTLRRNPHAVGGRGAEKPPHNYIAEGVKNAAGASLGNRNAAHHAKEYVDRQARIKTLVQQTKALAESAFAAVKTARCQREVLLALLAEPRHD